jgi:hypothetical protein
MFDCEPDAILAAVIAVWAQDASLIPVFDLLGSSLPLF